jgi:large subunit ribosomal protein L35
MKQKTHSGLKKRTKVKKSGKIMVAKSCKRHLLSNKSKKAKSSFKSGKLVDPTRKQSVKRLLVV